MKDEKKFQIKKPILVPFSFAVLTLLGVVFYSTYTVYSGQRDLMIQRPVDAIPLRMAALKKRERNFLGSMLGFISQIKSLQDAFIKGDRELLNKLSTPLFKRLKNQHNITHFYYTDLERNIFLRVHNPTKYGDRVDRVTQLNAEKNKSLSAGIELGRFGTMTLRVVIPWRSDSGKLIGYMELGKEMSVLIDFLRNRMEIDFFLFAEKKLYDKDLWEEGMGLSGQPYSWNQFNDFIFVGSTNDSFPPGMVEYLQSGGWKYKHPIKSLKSNGNDVYFYSVPMKDITGQTAGRIIGSFDISKFAFAMERHLSLVVLTCIVLGLLLAFLFYKILGSVENRVHGASKKVIESESNLSRAQRIAQFGSWEWRLLDNSCFFSEEGGRILGLGKRGQGSDITFLLSQVHAEDKQRLQSWLAKCREGESVSEIEVRIISTGGEERNVRCLVEVELDLNGSPIRLLGTIHDVTDKRVVERRLNIATQTFGSALEEMESRVGDLNREKGKLEEISLTDPLTNLGNRRAFEECLSRELENCRRNKHKMAVMFLDLDHFKPINDQFGHDVGDAVLKEVAHRMSFVMRISDQVFRIGGDEFAAILPNCGDEIMILSVAQRMLVAVSEPMKARSIDCKVGVSIGISLFPENGVTTETLLKKADLALYQVKGKGRGSCQIFKEKD
ncbi:MAG: diguanylate cyclase [Magnetococcales bacterium]|nr:diguanylate cyclase [Magnetococcales bacterium]